jgi:hypothetical protein
MRVNSALLVLLAVTPLGAPAEEFETPPLALLEYLGEWQDERGNEMDPQLLAQLPLVAAQEKGEDHDEK